MSVPQTDDIGVQRSPDDVPVAEWQPVLRRARLPRWVKEVGFVLSTYADHGTGRNAYPGRTRLALDVGVSVATVGRALNRLRQLDLITVQARGNRRRGLADTYRLTLPDRPVSWLPSKDEYDATVAALTDAQKVANAKRYRAMRGHSSTLTQTSVESSVQRSHRDQFNAHPDERTPAIEHQPSESNQPSLGVDDHSSPDRNARAHARDATHDQRSPDQESARQTRDVADLLGDPYRMPD